MSSVHTFGSVPRHSALETKDEKAEGGEYTSLHQNVQSNPCDREEIKKCF